METSPRTSVAEGRQMNCGPSATVYTHWQEAATAAQIEPW
jgi:hypothetical protein